jgi:hypothetical protein
VEIHIKEWSRHIKTFGRSRLLCPGRELRGKKEITYGTVTDFLYEVKLKYPTDIILLMVYNEMLM